MSRKTFILSSILVFFVVAYLLALSIDVFRVQRKKNFTGTHVVYVFNYGWHTGLILTRGEIPAPYNKHFVLWQNYRRIEISWGDNRFYRNQNPALEWPLAIRAIIWPTSSVLHVVGFNMPLDHIYAPEALQKIYLSKKDYLSLISYVSSFFTDDTVHPYGVLQKGLYGHSYFMKSKGKYVFPFTCNVWTARALKAGGIPITPILYQFSGVLMRVLRELGSKYPFSHQQVKYVRLKALDVENLRGL